MGKIKLRDVWFMARDTCKEWIASDPWRLSAVVAYYAVLSLPALLVIVINIAGSVLGTDAIQGKVSDEIGKAMGSDAAKTMRIMIASASEGKKTTVATILGIATLIFGATGVFYQLQKSLNEIWDVKENPKAGIKKLIINRSTGLGLIIVIGFLLLISLIISSLLTAFGNYLRGIFPDYLLTVFYLINMIVSLGIITILFALMFKFLPDIKIKWKSIWLGSLITSLLFVTGKYVLSIYFGKADPGSTYGATGSIILILLWVSYSCMILFFGAGFIKIYAKKFGHPVEVKKFANKIEIIEVMKK